MELCGQRSELLCFSHAANMQPMRGRRKYLSILTRACWSLLSPASCPACLPDLCLLAYVNFPLKEGEGFLGLLYQLLHGARSQLDNKSLYPTTYTTHAFLVKAPLRCLVMGLLPGTKCCKMAAMFPIPWVDSSSFQLVNT